MMNWIKLAVGASILLAGVVAVNAVRVYMPVRVVLIEAAGDAESVALFRTQSSICRPFNRIF